jgi:peptide deformylase
MVLLPLCTYGDRVLRQKAVKMTQEEVTEEFRQYLLNMAEMMYESSGVGLAANQVGQLKRFFIADWDQVSGNRRGKRLKDPSHRITRVFINPQILEFSKEDEEYYEGCLSLPQLEADVYRPVRIKVRYRNEHWEETEEWLEGFPARIFQHETDHLDGILFVDRIGEQTRGELAGQLNRMKKKTLAKKKAEALSAP